MAQKASFPGYLNEENEMNSDFAALICVPAGTTAGPTEALAEQLRLSVQWKGVPENKPPERRVENEEQTSKKVSVELKYIHPMAKRSITVRLLHWVHHVCGVAYFCGIPEANFSAGHNKCSIINLIV